MFPPILLCQGGAFVRSESGIRFNDNIFWKVSAGMQLKTPVVSEFLGYGLLSVLLWGSFAIAYPAIIAVGLLLCTCTFLLGIVLHGGIDRISALVLANYGLWLTSGLLTGSVSLQALTSEDFWSGEGRIFLYYLPIIGLGTLSFGGSQLNFFYQTCKVLIFAGLCLLSVSVLTNNPGLSMGGDSGRMFVGLMTSHTGAGTFWASITLFMLIVGMHTDNRGDFVWGFLALMLVLATDSRQSFVSLFAAVIWYCFRQRRLGPILGLAALVAIAVLLAGFTNSMRHRWTELKDTRTLDRVIETLKHIDGASELTLLGSDTDNFNIDARVYLWGYSLDLIKKSPFVGIGYGRFNDQDRIFRGLNGYFFVQTGGTMSHSEQNDIQANAIVNPGNAHNSYLHIFAENGIVGLFLLLFLWWNLYQHLESGRLPYGALNRFEQGCLFAFQALLISALVGALFGHALASPALGVVVMAGCGTGLGGIRQASNRVRSGEWVTMNE